MAGMEMTLRAFVEAKTSLAAAKENLACLQGLPDAGKNRPQLEHAAEQFTEYAELFDALLSRTADSQFPDES